MIQSQVILRQSIANIARLGGVFYLLSTMHIHAAPPMKLGDADVVPLHHWEIWNTFEYKRTNAEHQWKTPVFEVIYGLLPRTELALETAYDISESRDSTDSSYGLGFFSLQPKVQIFKETDHLPALAAYCKIEVPLDDEAFDWSGREWALALSTEKHFGDDALVGQIRCFLDADGAVTKWRYGGNWSHPCGDHFKLLAELYAENHLESGADELNFRLGFKYRLTDFSKIYAAAGRSLLTAHDNRPIIDCVTGLMFEF